MAISARCASARAGRLACSARAGKFAGVCTVVIHVPESPGGPIRLLALRDEHPDRAWDPLGNWWPNDPEILGVHDRRAGGAWLAVSEATHHLAVMMNRGEPVDNGGAPLESRGAIALDAAAGRWGAETPRTAAFNLLEARPDGARISVWNGQTLETTGIGPGVHMVAHSGVDDPQSPRIAEWLPAFREAIEGVAASEHSPAGRSADAWVDTWTETLERTTILPPTDDRAIVRDNRPLGIPTLTLYAVMAEIAPDRLHVWHASLATPGEWGGARFERVR